jgi:hypothetical protein
MEGSGVSGLTQDLANSTRDGIALQQYDDKPEPRLDRHDNPDIRSYKSTTTTASGSRPDQHDSTTPITSATGADCDRRRPEEGDHPRMATMSSSLVSKTVAPYLREHIPQIYAPVTKSDNIEETHEWRDPNSKFCYRHRPDSLCRRGADESKMVSIQRVRLLPSSSMRCLTIAIALTLRLYIRNSISFHLQTNRPSPMCGRSSAQHPRNTESSY